MKNTFFAFLLVLISALFVNAQIPRIISYQGMITDAAGNPVNGIIQITFSLYAGEETEPPVWTEIQTLTADNGLIHARLGNLTPLSIPFDKPYWLGITINEEEELHPREPLSSVPYSLNPQSFPVPLHLREKIDGQPVIEGINSSAVKSGSGVRGENSNTGNFGYLGDEKYGVYGFLQVANGSAVCGIDYVENKGELATGFEGVYGSHVKTGNEGSLASASSGAYGSFKNDLSDINDDNFGYLGTFDYGVSGQHGLARRRGYIGGDSVAVEGTHYNDNDITDILGQLASSNYAVYGKKGIDQGTLGYIGGDMAAVYGQNYNSQNNNYGCLACRGELIERIAPGAGNGRGCGVFGYEADKKNWGYIAYKEAGAFGIYTENNNQGWLGTEQGGVIGEHGENFNRGMLGTKDTGVTGYSGSNFGVLGRSTFSVGVIGDSNFGTGVEGWSSKNLGVKGTSEDSTGVYGESNEDYGVSGFSYENAGVHGSSAKSNGVKGKSFKLAGVYGENVETANFGYLGLPEYGVWGHSNGFTGIGVRGTVKETNAFAVRGFNEKTGAYGYIGGSTGVFGAYPKSATELNAGHLGTSNYAGSFIGSVYIQGDCQITGNLSKGSGSFKIDHPSDPANKYLSHSFVESPDMKNIYDGIIILDAKGEAEVVLPDYFETLNKDFRYQLTSIGAAGPELFIAEEIHNNRFKIAGGKKGQKVSWMVTGIRNDPYAEKYPVIVEEEKDQDEKGYYLHPELYGQPFEKDLKWMKNPELTNTFNMEKSGD